MTQRRRGFTLIELLVVMGIMVLLISILLPAISRAHRNAVRQSMTADLIILSQGLEAYKDDFGDYPRTGMGTNIKGSTVQVFGAATLCWALVAPGPQTQDGAGLTTPPDTGAPGFRIRPMGQGKIYGPYVSLDHFTLGTATGTATVTPIPGGTTIDDTNTVLADRYGHVILYFPGRTSVSPTASQLIGAYAIGTTPPTPSVYNFKDNAPYLPLPPARDVNELTQNIFTYRLGNVSFAAQSQSTDTPVVVPYLLWCAGPDGQFGPQCNSSQRTTGDDDDVIFPDRALSVPAGNTP